MIERLLVVKLGALGDFVLAFGPFAAIRRAHANAHITLLTTAPFADLARQSPYFDEVWIDSRPGWGAIAQWLDLRRRLRTGRFDRVYDLQTSDRSGWYYRLMGPGARPEWSGIARGCSHPHANPRRDFMHTIERQAEQLAMAGIKEVPPPDFGWIEADVARFAIDGDYALIVPGGAAHRPRKRWPAEMFSDLCRYLAEKSVAPVVLGGGDERGLTGEIAAAVPSACDLGGQTTIADIAVLARHAKGAVGNDTGPMHIVAASGCPCVVLFSDDSDPEITRPRGKGVVILQRPNLAELPVSDVAEALSLR